MKFRMSWCPRKRYRWFSFRWIHNDIAFAICARKAIRVNGMYIRLGRLDFSFSEIKVLSGQSPP